MKDSWITDEEFAKVLESLRKPPIFEEQFSQKVAFWWEKYDKIFILAYSEREANHYAHLRNVDIPRYKYTYVSHRDRLRGIRSGLVILLNGWQDNPASEELLHELLLLERWDTIIIKTEKEILDEIHNKIDTVSKGE